MAQHHNARTRLFFVASKAASKKRLLAHNVEEIARDGYTRNMEWLFQAGKREIVTVIARHSAEGFRRSSPVKEIGVRHGKWPGDVFLIGKAGGHEQKTVWFMERQRL